VKALVTGGAGFIGSHLCARLVRDGHEVICLDNLITGARANVAPLEALPSFQFVERDLIQPLGPDLDVPFDAIYHLASPASPVGYFRNPLATALVNSVGTNHCLDLARRHGARFLLASTSEVYGDPLEHPQREGYWGNVNPIGARSPYDEGKRFAEALTMVYVREYGVDARIVRIFNCYGPHSDPNDGRIVPNFVTQALAGQPITVYGDGTQTRSLCYVTDLVDGLVRAMDAPGTTGQVYNLGNPEEHTVREFAEVIKRLVGSASPIVSRAPLSEDEPQRRCPDISKASAELGWQPRVGLEEGLRLTIAWMRQRLGA
jgi:nucleoside-diphosphate-sugar epimerase